VNDTSGRVNHSSGGQGGASKVLHGPRKGWMTAGSKESDSNRGQGGVDDSSSDQGRGEGDVSMVAEGVNVCKMR
jgi:hypothetical protein